MLTGMRMNIPAELDTSFPHRHLYVQLAHEMFKQIFFHAEQLPTVL